MATLATMSEVPGDGLPLQLTTITVAVPGSPLSGLSPMSMVAPGGVNTGHVNVTPVLQQQQPAGGGPVSSTEVSPASVKWKYDQKNDKVGNTLVSFDIEFREKNTFYWNTLIVTESFFWDTQQLIRVTS